MSLPISPEDPLVVVVHEDEWKAYALHDPPTEWDQQLFQMIKAMGGINEDVEPGAYHFNAAVLDASNAVVQLEPIQGVVCSRIFHGF